MSPFGRRYLAWAWVSETGRTLCTNAPGLLDPELLAFCDWWGAIVTMSALPEHTAP